MKEKEATLQGIEDLKKFKERSGWSYEKIGNLMGIHPQTIVFWLTGKHKPSKLARSSIHTFLEGYSYK